MSRTPLLVVAVVTVALVLAALAAELAAAPVAARIVERELTACATFEEVESVTLGRPALPGLVRGRARDVEVVVTGIELEQLVVARAVLRAPELALGWGPAPTAALAPAELELELTAAAIEAWLASRTPAAIEPVVELEPGVLVLGVAPLPFRVRLEVAVEDGVLVLSPTARLPAWFASLGLDLRLEVPGALALDRLELRDGLAVATVPIDPTPRPGEGGPAGPGSWCPPAGAA